MDRDGLWFLWIHNIDKLPQLQERVCISETRLSIVIQLTICGLHLEIEYLTTI